MSGQEMFTVRSTDRLYNSPLIGNGQVVTTVGPTGYHNGLCPAEEAVNRTIFWAGRRLRDAREANIRIPRVPPEELIGPTRPLIRFGRLVRTLTVDGAETTDDDWEQVLDCDRGVVISTLNQGTICERTQSLVCLTASVLVFHTRLENQGDRAEHLVFSLEYEFGDAEGVRGLAFPHPAATRFDGRVCPRGDGIGARCAWAGDGRMRFGRRCHTLGVAAK